MKRLLALMALLLIACDSVNSLIVDVPTTPTATLQPTSTVIVEETPAPTLEATVVLEFDALYEAQVIVDQLIIRNGEDGSEAGTRLNAGDYVTVVQKRALLGDARVPDPPGGWWCLIEPREFDEWVACEYLHCSRHCE